MNNLTTLKSNLKNNIDSSGYFELNASNLAKDSGAEAPDNLDQLIQSSLYPYVEIDDVKLKVSGDTSTTYTLSPDNTILTIDKVKVDILAAMTIDAEIVFTLSSGTVDFTINASPATWSFGSSFPSISNTIDALMEFSEVQLIFSTSKIDSFLWKKGSNDPIKLIAGLNFASDYDLSDLPLIEPFFNWGDSTFQLPKILLFGDMKPAESDAVAQVFPSLDITAAVAGDPKLTFPISESSEIVLTAPTVSLHSSGFSLPNISLDLTITLGKTNKVDVDIKTTILRNSDRLSLLVSSEKGVGLEQLFDLFPGGEDFWQTIVGTSANPTFLHDPLESIVFLQLSADFSLGTKKAITSIQSSIGSTAPLTFFDKMFTIESFLVNWTCLNPTEKTRYNTVTMETNFKFSFLPQLDFDITMSTEETISGTCTGTLSLEDVIKAFNTQSSDQISLPFHVSLSDFQLYMDFGGEYKSYRFGATANADLELLGEELLAVKNAQITIEAKQVEDTQKPGTKIMDYTAKMDGILDLFGIDFEVTAEIKKGKDPETVVSVHMVDRTLGELLDMIVKFISRDSKAILPFPWSELNNIKMDALVLTITMKDDLHEVSVTYLDDIKIGFIDITGFTLSYTKKKQKNGEWTKATQVSLNCTFFGKSYNSSDGNAMAWDPVNGNPPAVPDKGSILDLRYLGIGQHISFSKSADTNDMQSVLRTLEHVAPPPTRNLVPGMPVKKSDAHPLSDLSGLEFNGNSNWFIGADFTIMGAVSLGLVFNDPQLYGLIVSLSGPKVKALAGLQFEILYRKITDSIGEYYIELKLPTVMRQIQLGEVSITLPVIGVAIYTNGNFKLDFGFPWHNDFSRSCGVQVFPFVGAGGFYFGVLDGATSSQTPKITGGSFDPVIVFGFGLQVGLGKSVNEGILSAKAEITVAGILQGVIGFYEPDNKNEKSAHFYKLQGVVGISGVLSGSINFVVISANVLVHVYADARFIYESYEPIKLGLDIGVEVRVSLKVLFVHIHFSFSAHISENFTIGSKETPPWTLAPNSSGTTTQEVAMPEAAGGESLARTMVARSAMTVSETESSAPHSADFMASPASFVALDDLNAKVGRGARTASASSLDWNTAGDAYFSTVPQMELYFVPSPTALNPAKTKANNDIAIVSMLYTKNNITDKGDTHTSFDNLMVTTLAWALKSGIVSGFESLTEDTASTTSISYTQLETLLDGLYDNPTPKPGDIENFLKNNFSSVNIEPYSETADTMSGTVFPMLPELTLKYGTSEKCDFSIYNAVDKDYVNDVNTYLQALNFLPNPAESASFTGTESMAQMVFNDYFNLVLQGVVQTAKSALSMYKYTVGTGAVSDQLNKLGVETSSAEGATFVAFVHSNMGIVIAEGTQIKIDALPYTVKGAAPTSPKTLIENLIGSTTGTSTYITELINTNLFVSNSLATGSSFAPDSLTFKIPSNKKTDIAALFGAGASVHKLSTPIPGAPDDAYNPYTELMVTGGTYETTADTETIELIAFQFYTTPSLIRGKNQSTLKGHADTEALPKNMKLNLPDIKYQVGPNTQYYIATFFGVDIDKLSIPPGASYESGTVVTIKGIDHKISENMNLAQLGNLFRITDASTLIDLVTDMNIIAPGTILSSPHFTYTTVKDETPAIISQRFNLDLDALVMENLAVFYPENAVIEIPKATVDVAALMKLLFSHEGKVNFNNIAGQVSRFLLHGLRLPIPGQKPPILINGKANPEAETGPLYELTGQQFELKNTTSLTLMNTNSTSWISFTGGGNSGDVDLTTTKMAAFISGLKTSDITFAFNFEEYKLYREVALRYTFQHSMNWTTPHLPEFMNPPANGSISASPAIWTFPEELKQKLSKIKQLKESPMHLDMLLGSRDKNGTNSLTTTPVEGYRWSTIIDVKIKAIESKLSPATGQLSYIYSLEGLKNEEERHILTDLITAYKDDVLKPDLYFLFDNEGANSGVVSDLLSDPGTMGDKVRIVKSNLSSILAVDHPSEVVVEAGLQSDPLIFLELLWEGSLLENGGYYLQYQNAQGQGLPTSLFSKGPITTIKLMILCPTDVTDISSFFNSVVLESPVDTSRNILMAKSPDRSDYQSLMKPGNLGINVTCTEPGDSATIQNIYSLLTAQVNKNSSYDKSTFAMPAGPVQQPETSDSTWDFHHVLPIAQMYAGSAGSATPGFPNPENSPYTAVGSTLDMTFYFQDIFGNLATSQSEAIPSPINKIGYFDELVAISNWPGVSASYDFTSGASDTIDLNAYLDFDPSRYLPNENTTLEQCIGKAQKDSDHFQSIYYQLLGTGVSVSMSTSMGTTTPPASAAEDLQQLLGQLYQLSNTVQLLKVKSFNPGATDTLNSLTNTYHTSIAELTTTNKLLTDVFAPTDGKIVQPNYYTIKHGDSINSIVKDPNNHITDPAVTWGLTFKDQTDVLQTGTEIIITPGETPIKYTIQKEDSFTVIAEKFSTNESPFTAEDLITQNLDTQNVFEDSLQVLASTNKVTYSTTDSIETIAQSWNITLEQFGLANGSIALNQASELTVPETFELPDSQSIDNYRLINVSDADTLTTIATTNNVLAHDIFVLNQGLMNVVETTTPIDLPGGKYTPDANDTLYTLYQRAKNASTTELSVDDFIAEISTFNLFKTGVLLLPVQHIQLTSTVTAKYSAEIFEITASLCIQRQSSLIDTTVPDDVVPAVSRVTELLTAHMEHDGDKPATMQSFATKFESAFSNRVKVVIHREPSGDNSESKHIWAAPIVEGDSAPNASTMAYFIDDGEGNTPIEYFAVAPLANRAVTQEKVDIYPYSSASGKSATPIKINFTKIDMDAWAKTFLDALHLLSASDYAVAASDLDIDSFNKLMQAKQNIASAISSSVIPVFGDTPASPTPQMLAAQEALKESLLQNLSTAYTVDTIIQLGVEVKNSTSTEKDAVRLTGKPVLKSYAISETDTLATIATSTFGEKLTTQYLGNVVASVPGLIRSYAVTSESFKGIPELTTQDSANIYYGLIDNGVLDSSGILKGGFGPTTELHLKTVYESQEEAIRAVLTDAHQKQQDNKLGSVIPTPTDTFQSIATKQTTTLDTFIESIESSTVLNTTVLNFAWNNYTPSNRDTIATLADRYNVLVQNFYSANLLVENILKPQTIDFPESGSIAIKSSDTLNTLLVKLNLSLDKIGHAADHPDAIKLINFVGLFNASASVGVLRAQSAINLSTADIALTQDTSHLTFLMSKGSESNSEIGENAFVDFSYQLNGLKKESGVETLPGFEDYSNLSFVLEFENNQDISLEAPIPLRTPPIPPVITAQGADYSNALATELGTLKTWAYEIDYEQNEAVQDELDLKLYFNHEVTKATSGGSSTELGPLFGSLANFISNWPILEHDLEMIAPMSQKLPMDDKQPASATIPLKYFADLAEEIANNWLTWHEDIAKINQEKTVAYTPYECLIQEFSDEKAEFAIHLYEQGGTLPQNAKLLPIVISSSGEEYTPENQSISGDPGKIIHTFSKFTTPGNSKPLSYSDGQQYNKRHFKVEKLDILQTKEAASSLAMMRNKDLINGQVTNPAFVFVTPEVSYVNGCTPFIKSTNQFNIATLFQQTGKHTLAQYLQTFFTELFEFDQNPDKVYPMTIDCQYAFAVNESIPDLTANRAVVMHPLYDFKKQDCNATVPTSFVAMLAAAITKWEADNTTSLSQDKNAFYQFDLTVFTDETMAKPYFELSGLVLYLKDIV